MVGSEYWIVIKICNTALWIGKKVWGKCAKLPSFGNASLAWKEHAHKSPHWWRMWWIMCNERHDHQNLHQNLHICVVPCHASLRDRSFLTSPPGWSGFVKIPKKFYDPVIWPNYSFDPVKWPKFSYDPVKRSKKFHDPVAKFRKE